jgi:hypothetical protein
MGKAKARAAKSVINGEIPKRRGSELRMEEPQARAISTSVAAAIAVVVMVVAAGTLLIEGRDGSTATLTTYGSEASVTASSIWLSPTSSPPLSCGNVSESSSQIAISSTSSGPLSISVVQATTDPLNSQPGDSIYIYGLKITDGDQGPYPVNESFFTMTTSSNSVFHAVSVPAIQHSLVSTTLSPNQDTAGQIAFQIPTAQNPVSLRYSIPGSANETIASLPAPAGAVSEPNPSIITNVQYDSDLGFEVLNVHPYIPNDTGYFYPGQVIPVVLAFTDTVDGTNEEVNSITSGTTALNIIQISPPPPLLINGYSAGINYNELVCMYAPQTGFTGNIVLNIIANDW